LGLETPRALCDEAIDELSPGRNCEMRKILAKTVAFELAVICKRTMTGTGRMSAALSLRA
jgi:hypothetical protein